MRVLFISPMLPGKGHGGGHIATANFTSAFKELGADVTVLGFQTHDGQLAHGEISAGRLTPETSTSRIRAAVWGTQAILQRRAYTIQKWMSRRYKEQLLATLNAYAWDLIIVEHAQMAWVARHLAGRPFVFLAHNAESEIYRELADMNGGMTRYIYDRECRLISRAEAVLAQDAREVWTLSESDADYFRALGSRHVESFEVGSISVPRAPASFIRPCAAMLGSWTWSSNRAGLDWYLAHVHPLLRETIFVEIAGRGAEDVVGLRPNLSSQGYVADAFAFLSDAACILVPSTKGGGIQIKTLDAIATGRPVIATEVAVRGLSNLPACVRIARSASAFVSLTTTAVLDIRPADSSGPEWMRLRRVTFKRHVNDASERIRNNQQSVLWHRVSAPLPHGDFEPVNSSGANP
jgi:glycosyltransferase involved in cell wall biosynthesis